jgi:hypothetical protein
MPRDPFAVLGLPLDASSDAIKAAWRKLAREHHPDVSSGEPGVERRATKRMAEINAAYQELRDPVKRRAYRDAAARARAARGDVPTRSRPGRSGRSGDPAAAGEKRHSGEGFSSADGFYDSVTGEGTWPNRPRPSRPVTARIDTSTLLRPRNTTLRPLDRSALPGLPPRPRSAGDHEPPRASTPTGPMHRRRGPNMDKDLPSLADAMELRLGFGKFSGMTLGEVAAVEPSYIDWIVRTISSDPETSLAARVVLRHLLTAGPIRRPRLDTAVPHS